MKQIANPKKFFNELVDYAISATSSGHPFLDERWAVETGKHRRPYYRFCQELVRQLKPKLVVELGIDEGSCSGHFASGSLDTTVLGVDVHKDGEGPSDQCRLVEKQFSNFKYLRGWTWAQLPNVKAYGPIDVLYIDSWHEFDYFAKDWNDYAPLLADNHIVLVDDLQFPEINSGFEKLPAAFKEVDHRMNSAVPFGYMMGVDKTFKFEYATREWMPN